MKMIKILLNMLFHTRRKSQAQSHIEEKKTDCKKKKEEMVKYDNQQLRTYLIKNYVFRYNVLTNETEFCSKDDVNSSFIVINQREQNSLCMDIQAQGILCWDRDLNRFLYSNHIPAYHPFKDYLKNLPAWDETDRLEDLAHRVSKDEMWVKNFHKWMLGVTSQWMGITGVHANSTAPVLISKEQGKCKSTFCKSLMPLALQRYYTDNIALTAAGQTERKLSEMGIINLDEFDRFSTRKMAYLKNLMQMADPNIRKPYKQSFQNLPRVASFIATSNRKDLLTDPTGSRRFICVEVEGKINCSNIYHEQIYAQLKAELQADAQYWFTAEEERELQKHNQKYYHQSPSEEVFLSCFRPALKDEDNELLTATEIFTRLKKYNPAAMRSTTPMAFARILSGMGIERKHTKWGNAYRVVALI